MKKPLTSSPTKTQRSRKAEKTKAAILASARQAFAELGYDGAGVRGIAQGAGVTAMMVNRYFGSKEQLFAEAVAASMADPTILSQENLDSPARCRKFAEALIALTGQDETPLDGFLILFRSTANETAARIAKEQIAAIHQRTAEGAASDSEHSAQKAALFLSIVAGVQMMRQMIGLSALADADPKTLADLLTPLFERLIGNPSEAD